MISHRPLLHLVLRTTTPRIPPFAWLVLRVLFLLALVGQGGLLFVYGQPDDDFFFDCEETLVLTTIDNKVALFNLTSRTVYNVTGVTPGDRRFAAIDEATRVLYIWELDFRDVFYRRFDATTSTFLDATPFTLDPAGPDTSLTPQGFDFVNGEMYLIDGLDVVQAQVNLPANANDDATLNVTNSSVATLPSNGFQPLAWDSCNRTLYSTDGSTAGGTGIAAIDIDTGNLTVLGTVTLPDDGEMFGVIFRDITVGPNCELYGIISVLLFDGSVNSTLRGSVAQIDPVNLKATVLLAASDDEEGFLGADVTGIASCSDRSSPAPTPAPTTPSPTPAPTTQAPTPAPPTDKCIVHPKHDGANTEAYDSAESFLAEEVYEVGEICYYPGKDDSHQDGNGDGRDLSARTIKVCCETTAHPSPDCVPCEDCSIDQEVDDACCAWAFWFDPHHHHNLRRHLDGTYWGGCKTKHGPDHVCCKCADDRYICMPKDNEGDCAQACVGSP